jgi:hypothetical protein
MPQWRESENQLERFDGERVWSVHGLVLLREEQPKQTD